MPRFITFLDKRRQYCKYGSSLNFETRQANSRGYLEKPSY